MTNDVIINNDSGLLSVKRFKVNPFLDDLILTAKSQQVKISKLGEKDTPVLVNQENGEVLSRTDIITYRRVDKETFVKVFSAQFDRLFDLNGAGIKALTVMLYSLSLSISKDLVQMDDYMLDDFVAERGKKFSKATFYRGIQELISAGIIAKNIKPGFYFINPSFCFNGDRLTLSSAIGRS